MAQSLETLRSALLTSLFGRRLGLDVGEYLSGAKSFKHAVEDITSTVPTTVLAYGITRIGTMSSTQGPVQHFLPAPVPGVEKTITHTGTSTGSHQFLSTANGGSIYIASLGTTGGVVNIVGPAGSITLVGLSTSVWGVKHEGPYTSTALAKAVTFTTST